ncbi:MAG: hypothetical protein QXU18_10970 [Thermoplasmatales archaeon]
MKMRKGSPEAKAWGRKMQKLRSHKERQSVYKRRRSSSTMAKKRSYRRPSKMINFKGSHKKIAEGAIVGLIVGAIVGVKYLA